MIQGDARRILLEEIMGDVFDLIDVQVIQGGLIQLDIKNLKTMQGARMFVNPSVLFSKIGKSMESNMDEWLRTFQADRK